MCPESRNIIFFCCRCCCQSMLLRSNTVLLHCCCGSGSMFSLVTRYLVPVRTSTSECGMPAECISMGVPVALGQAMSSVLALRCCVWSIGCEFGTSVDARAGCTAFTLVCLDCDTVMQPGGICWPGQVQRDVFTRWPITQRCTMSNAQQSSIFSGACISDICRNLVSDTSNSPMRNINIALLLVAGPPKKLPTFTTVLFCPTQCGFYSFRAHNDCRLKVLAVLTLVPERESLAYIQNSMKIDEHIKAGKW